MNSVVRFAWQPFCLPSYPLAPEDFDSAVVFAFIPCFTPNGAFPLHRTVLGVLDISNSAVEQAEE